MRQYVVVACSAVVALAVNIVMDLYTDVPMLVRWAVAIAIAMVVTWLLLRWSMARARRDPAAMRDSSGPVR